MLRTGPSLGPRLHRSLHGMRTYIQPHTIDHENMRAYLPQDSHLPMCLQRTNAFTLYLTQVSSCRRLACVSAGHSVPGALSV